MKHVLLAVALCSSVAAAAPNRRAICMTGDSLTYGYTFDSTTIALRLATLRGVPVVNMGVGSAVASTISARWTRYGAPFLYDVSIWEGCTNDFAASATGADCWATTEAWIEAVEAAGQRAAGLSVFCRGGSGGWTDAKEAQRLTYNGLMSAYALSNPSFIYVDAEFSLCDPAVAASGTVTLGGGAGNVTIVTDGTSVGPVAFNTSDAQTALDAITALNANGTFAAKATASSGGSGVVLITWDTTGPSGNVTLTASRTAGSATASGATLTGGLHPALRSAVDWGDHLHINGDGMQEVAEAIDEALGP